MRLFAAINFNNEVKQRIGLIQDQIRKKDPKGKFSLPENIHLTLVFLGETAAERLPDHLVRTPDTHNNDRIEI